jgi:plastocyanin
MSNIARKTLSSVLGLLFAVGAGFAFSETQGAQSVTGVSGVTDAVTDVSIVNFDFLSPIVTVDLGDMVHWTNNSPSPHTVVSGGPFDPNPGSIWDSGLVSPGDDFSFTFDTQGKYHYFCDLHPLTMFGEVIAGENGVKVAVVPDDISPAALSSLNMNVAVINFTQNTVSGNLWFVIRLPNNNEFVIPSQFLTPHQNPLSGQLAGNNRLDISVTLNVPPSAPSGQYKVRALIGNFPNQVVDDDDYEFEIP